jgi:multisubunit Na+/H+ antiporter MnhE subunit
MADAEIFVSNALLSIAFGSFCMIFYLINRNKGDEDPTAKYHAYGALLGVLLSFIYGFAIQSVGFNVTGLFDQRDFAITMSQIFTGLIVVVFVIMMFSAVKTALKVALDALAGKRNYDGKKD